MAALFAQMWLLELAAFLLGGAVTWLVFVRPARAAARDAAYALPAPDPVETTEPAVPVNATDPALAALDAHARHARRTGHSAVDVLTQMGTTPPRRSTPTA
jgi:hypothetical protein